MTTKRTHPRRRWQDPFLYTAAVGASATLRALGPDFSGRALGEIGDVYGRAPFNRARIERSVANIRWCFPEFTDSRARAVAHASYRHLFMLGAEVSMSSREFDFTRWPHWIELGRVREAVRCLLSGPAILITGHCGNWELLGAWLGALGVPMHAVYRPLKSLALDRWVRQTRARLGIDLVDKFGAADSLPTLLKQKEPVAFIADQNAGDRGLFVPFFDRLASTYKSIGLLAMRYEIPIICGGAIRQSRADTIEAPHRLRYLIDAPEVITPDEWTDHPDPLFYITARYRRAIESTIRRAPEQYLWMQRAWRSRPRFERDGKPMPRALRVKLESLPWMTEESMRRIVESSNPETPAPLNAIRTVA